MNYKRLTPDFIRIESVDSTNNYAVNLLKVAKPAAGTTVLTKRQTAGRGQRGNTWEVDPDLNLTFSVIVYPEIPVTQVHQLNFMVALALSKALRSFAPSVLIKWPNDILAVSKKLAGVLIENQFRGSQVASTIIGIGVNVNQLEFSGSLNACSLKSITGIDYDLDQVFLEIYAQLDFYLNLLMEQNFNLLSKSYHETLYGKDEERRFIDANGEFSGVIQGVDDKGLLKIKCDEGIRKFDLKEIRFVF
ncbi:MAG: biotin--[acetyl-CoA-carboxylase] ligase [Crocinitomicaceae bacterium]|nr:biotin--[acetyl-CoA-carboxylase] ligase [Crocinitomicaceae bacterium]